MKRYKCDAGVEKDVENLFQSIHNDFGRRADVVIHNIDGRTGDIFRKKINEADAELVKKTLMNSVFSAFLVGKASANLCLTLIQLLLIAIFIVEQLYLQMHLQHIRDSLFWSICSILCWQTWTRRINGKRTRS